MAAVRKAAPCVALHFSRTLRGTEAKEVEPLRSAPWRNMGHTGRAAAVVVAVALPDTVCVKLMVAVAHADSEGESVAEVEDVCEVEKELLLQALRLRVCVTVEQGEAEVERLRVCVTVEQGEGEVDRLCVSVREPLAEDVEVGVGHGVGDTDELRV